MNPFYSKELDDAVQGLKTAVKQTPVFKALENFVRWLAVKAKELRI